MFIKKIFFAAIIFLSTSILPAQTLEKKYLNNQSYTYSELMAAYNALAKSSPHASLIKMGLTDSGEDIWVFAIANNSKVKVDLFNTAELGILIMNGIHAGESCGIDASLHWSEKLLKNIELIGDATIYVIPAYNVGGSLNRSCCTRANQEGPELMGFRGNGNNLDLNRDFMKMDALNTRTFRQILQSFDPDIFVDTHSTNGADYQYSMTLIPNQSEKWEKPMNSAYANWFEEVMHTVNDSVLTQYYVNVWGKTPADGFSAFETSSVYSTGFTGLYRVFGITTEAHMFKPYPKRVDATMATLDAVLKSSLNNKDEIVKARKSGLTNDLEMTDYAVEWKLDSTYFFDLLFHGYQVERFTSKLTGQERYRYNRNQPFSENVLYYPTYKAVQVVKVPEFYVLQQGQHKAIDNLRSAGVEVDEIKKDTTMFVTGDYVTNIEYANRPYEGHFAHKKFETEKRELKMKFRAGDYLIRTRQERIRFILEALEPESPGSFFRWNYFDTYLQQKEWFSMYIFEEKAIEFLSNHPQIKAEFESKKELDEGFASNAFAQVYWIYQQTPFYEKEHMRIPVFRVF